MIYAYELLPHLTHLTLTGRTEEGLEFVGTDQQWKKVNQEIEDYEREDFSNGNLEDHGL